ncbi:hypothetical protein [Streptomyces sp. A5-4]|uniref:hypothetical protein n=1 Tax=Streptomyces sp. A5-4 TaxID=3384771 RepID=UPI003DA8EF85
MAEQKTAPASVAAQSLDALEEDLPEILADGITRQVRLSLSGPPAAVAVTV